MPLDVISVRGAREHNLKNIDVTLPRDKLVVITGPSGSGKSSLAFDTIYAEGQRRYVESLSAYARQFLGQMEKPDVDYIEGLSPAISIDQKGASRNPRSTVATVTEVYDYLRLLFARTGHPHCPTCGREVQRQTVQQIVDSVAALPHGTRFMVMSPLVTHKKGEHVAILEDLRKAGYVRVRVNAQVRDLSETITLDRNKWHTIEAVVDRVVIPNAGEDDNRGRITDSVETALKLGAGVVLISIVDQPARPQTDVAQAPSPAPFPDVLERLEGKGGRAAAPAAQAWAYAAHPEPMDGRAIADQEGPGGPLPPGGREPERGGSTSPLPPGGREPERGGSTSPLPPGGGELERGGRRRRARQPDPAPEELLFSEHFSCVYCGTSLGEIAPRTFSFNSPHGACPDCTGLGTKLEVDPDLVAPNKDLTLAEGALQPWQRAGSMNPWYNSMIAAVAKRYGFSTTISIKHLKQEHLDVLLYGDGERIKVAHQGRHGHHHQWNTQFEGVIPNLMRRYRETESDYVRSEIERYMSANPCPTCNAKRLKPEALAVKVAGKNISEVTGMSIVEGLHWVDRLAAADTPLTPREQTIAYQILKELRGRLGFLVDVGLDYITLDRAAASLSGGEGQRIRLATQIGSGLMGVLYVCDEPSIGLHAIDNQRLIDTLVRLRDLGNTIIIVEHDEAMMRAADYLVDMGPGAGEHGGEVVASGTLHDVMKEPRSLTGQYLSGVKEIPTPPRRRPGNGNVLVVRGAKENNLRDIDVRIPLGMLVCITGVSGSGKSTLVYDILYKKLAQVLYRAKDKPGEHAFVEGIEHIDKVINIDQSPIGRTPRSNPATYTGAFTPIRDLFAAMPEARMRGYTPGRFSFNVKGGRCEACKGEGFVNIEMHFLPDIEVPCDICKGRRYNREALEVKFNNRNIADVLEMTVEEAAEFFSPFNNIRSKMDTLNAVGLSYMRVGQPATTLSGGEAQRVKLSTELSKRATGRTLYILDEPTTGLAFDDVAALLRVLQRLVDAGNTVLLIEHHLDMIKNADWLIDLGPGGGHRGGAIIATGTPEEVAQVETSHTGQFLSKIFANRPKPNTNGRRKK